MGLLTRLWLDLLGWQVCEPVAVQLDRFYVSVMC